MIKDFQPEGISTGYLAPEGLEDALERQLQDIVLKQGRLFLAKGPRQAVHWIQNVWIDPQVIPFSSISDGAKKLRSLQGLWAYYPTSCVRRGELILSQLPFFSPKPLHFLDPLPKTPIGSWTLLDHDTILASPHTSSPFANGEARFVETKIPPSRAYLKLWELFTLIGLSPKKGESCLEIGASPGGWTWTLQQLGAEIIAVDRSPLAPAVAQLPRVTFLQQDAFSLSEGMIKQPIDWIFSDVVCYPEKLLAWIRPWLTRPVHLVCTIKFQGSKDSEIIKEFEKIEGSKVFRLFHNKHELCWYRKRSNTIYHNYL